MSVPTIAAGDPTANSKWRMDVDTAFDPTATTPATPVWAQVRGISNFTPAVENSKQDASDYDSDGWGADAVTARKWRNECEVFRKEYGGKYDPAQEFLRAAADAAKIVHVRWYERGTTAGEAYEGYALVEWAPQGGDYAGLSKVQMTILGQGARATISAPTA